MQFNLHRQDWRKQKRRGCQIKRLIKDELEYPCRQVNDRRLKHRRIVVVDLDDRKVRDWEVCTTC